MSDASRWRTTILSHDAQEMNKIWVRKHNDTSYSNIDEHEYLLSSLCLLAVEIFENGESTEESG